MIRALALAVLVAGCASVPQEIQGTWSASGPQDEVHSWTKEYTIDGDGYVMDGYPPIHEECDLEHVGTEGSVHTLRATDCSMEGPGMGTTPQDDHDVQVEVAGGAIVWNGQGLTRQ